MKAEKASVNKEFKEHLLIVNNSETISPHVPKKNLKKRGFKVTHSVYSLSLARKKVLK